ncbi:MAG: PD40 domain-containing protein [Bacteroidetes bacterium]|nr:PD40 domain-containing protein [Bacteroidota bacterium]
MRTSFVIIVLSLGLIVLCGCPEKYDNENQNSVNSISTTHSFVTNGINPSVSPSNALLAFSINGEIYISDTSGIVKKKLTNTSTYEFMPRWHPSGSSIGFIRMFDTINGYGELILKDTATGLETIIDMILLKNEFMLSPNITHPIWSFSPNGEYVSLISNSGDSTFLNSYSIQNGNKIKSILTSSNYLHDRSCFDYSSSGNLIYFIANDSNNVNYLYYMDISSNDKPKIIENSFFSMFPSRLHHRNDIGVSIAGSPYVVFDTNSEIIEKHYLIGANPKWSHDGRFILSEVFSVRSGANGFKYSTLTIKDVGANKMYRLTTDGDIDKHNYFFEWDGTSRNIYYQKNNSIWKVHITI